MSSPKVAIVIYSMYGHIAKCMCFLSIHSFLSLTRFLVAESVKAGIETAGGTVTIFQ
jgi:NAD(P)H dehydrogenase (quinone)